MRQCSAEWQNDFMRSTIAASFLAFACSAGDPLPVAEKYERARIAGDLVIARAMISRADSAAWAAPAGRNISPANFGLEEGGIPGAHFDSVRRGAASSDDTVLVESFLTVPNWETVGGRLKWNGSSHVDQAKTDLALMAGLPRITQKGVVRLVREGRHWSISLGIGHAARLQPYWAIANNEDSSYSVRTAAARQYLSVLRSPGPRLPYSEHTDSTLSAFIASQSIVDSLEFSLGLGRLDPGLSVLGTHELKGEVRNRSHSAVYLVVLRVTFTSGETEDVYAFNVPPQSRKEASSYGRWSGDIARTLVSQVQLKE